jgi:transposase
MPNILTLNQITSLRVEHKKAKDKRSADRIKAVYLWGIGYSYEEIARVLMLDETTLRRYVERFKEVGVDGLLESRYAGGVADMTTIQQKELAHYLEANTLPTASAVVAYIEEKYRIVYTPNGVTKLLHRLGFSYKKPRVIPGKVNLEKQAEFMTEYDKIKAGLGKHDSIHFMDASHPTHNTTLSYGWIKQGRKNDKFIATNTGRQRLNLHGALNLSTLTATTNLVETVNAQSVLKTLNTLLKKYPHGKIHLILDNAKYYHSNLIKEWRRHHTRVKFHFIPPYSPNLNIIERLWLYYHKKVTHNRYFPKFEDFRQATLYFFRHLKRYESDLTRLLTDNFQTYPATAVANLS